MRRKVMTRPTHPIRHVVVLIAAMLSTGCGYEASTEPASTGEPSSAPFTVYTHCGIESTRINGHWWHATPPLYNQDGSGPPVGWGDPYQEGALTMESADRAVFDALGQRIIFVPSPDDEPVRVCR